MVLGFFCGLQLGLGVILGSANAMAAPPAGIETAGVDTTGAASSGVDTTVVDTTGSTTTGAATAAVVSRDLPRHFRRTPSRLQDSNFLNVMVSAVPPADGLLAFGTRFRWFSTQYKDGDFLIPADIFDLELFFEANLHPLVSVRGVVPYRRYTIGVSPDLDTQMGLGDGQWEVVANLPLRGDTFFWSLFGGANIAAGDQSKGLTEGVASPHFGAALSLRLWRDAQAPEFRLHLNAGYRWNKNEDQGYGVGLGEGLEPWFPRYNDAAGAGGADWKNDYFILGLAAEFRQGTTSLWLEYTQHQQRWDENISTREWARILRAGLRWGVIEAFALHFAYEVGLHRDDPATIFWPAYPDMVYNLGVSFQIGVGGVDGDGDGISDRHDHCPDLPEDLDGFEDEDGCPEYDNDLDGIPDRRDGAPNEAEDFDGFADEDGVPDPDNDADGIPDVDDLCPDEPEDYDGREDDDGCPEEQSDRDGDGVYDRDDHCPDDTEDRDGFEDDDGCPELDNDLDGIEDRHDQCPDEPEDYNGVEDDDGCPDADNEPGSSRVPPQNEKKDSANG